MALVGNFSVLNKTAGKHLAGSSTAGAAQAFTRANHNKPSDWRKFSTQDWSGGTGTILKLAALPAGYYPQGAWALPTQRGALSTHSQCDGAGVATLSVSGGVAAAGTADGDCTVTGTGALVVSGDGLAEGTSSATASVTAALNGDGATSGTSTASATVDAIGNMTASADGTCTVAAISYATGALVGSISPFTELSPESLAASVANIEIETGYTLKEILQIVSSTTAGKASGYPTATIVHRNVTDTEDRVTATVDADGNRTAITYSTDE